MCRVYAFVALICLTRKCVRDSQRDEADEILTHGYEWHLEWHCAVSQSHSETRIWRPVSKSKARGRMFHKMEDIKNGKVS